MVSFPPCKINLGLNIISKRPDGYHDLITCFYPVPWYDILEIIPATDFSFSSSGLPIPGDPEANLCIKAYRLLKKDFDLGNVSMHLHKILPMGAGLGGGSADAAWVLRTLDQVFNLQLTSEKLRYYASQLGSDCAFFISDKPMLGTGRGEVLEPVSVNLAGKFMVLVKPDIHVSTAEAYSAVRPGQPAHDLNKVLEQQPVDSWKGSVVNDFEDSVFRRYPLIARIKETLYAKGALYASMSGSGSAVFGIFSNPTDLRSTFEAHVYWSGVLG
ncbi:4-(cytidine 5'-diphospho)-2-C-methyl-D-erythritol kinase [Fulvivirgaceae bacterium PWU4]|uniref:4-diphosphocytidyl-2-C-methyl-D-erythritol kinase n=1 Tax=Chryseosolibacter histidini TaxID=2782349 RepID=A0AAP2GN85_9BACT|nr:4-(cytidine 5'-diphospho)-2-C-methyl-D-erythritol kinase [Chryseosolibacter histidini]MBT1696247.1 4-(cytidine 5'-diphospho)-2-C-methyl-D-erythritol kinase [Chryseosolibacter histidini]